MTNLSPGGEPVHVEGLLYVPGELPLVEVILDSQGSRLQESLQVLLEGAGGLLQVG